MYICKMWNSSFYREGYALTADIWITSDQSESGTLNTFRCFRKLPQSSVCKWQWKWKGVYFFCLQFFRNQEKMRDKDAWASAPSRSLFMQVITMAFFGKSELILLFYLWRWPPWCSGVCWTWSLPFSSSRWQVYSMIIRALKSIAGEQMAACNVAAGWTRGSSGGVWRCLST